MTSIVESSGSFMTRVETTKKERNSCKTFEAAEDVYFESFLVDIIPHS